MEIMMVQIKENGKVIGKCTCEEFRKVVNKSKIAFLSDLINEFNLDNEACGWNARAEIILT